MSEKVFPPCQAACPIHTDVRGYVSAIAESDAEKALSIIRRVNPLPSVCARICTRLCEAACRRAQVDKPVSIRALKRFAADHAKTLKREERPQNSYDERIAIVGSGPAGLTAAHDLALLGYKATIFEAQSVLGGLLSEGIPEYRLPKSLVKKEIDDILSLGIEAKTGLILGKDFTLEGLLKEYQAVFLAVGSQKSLLPRCDGSDLPGVMSGVEFLKWVCRGELPDLGKKVLVIGGGHTAIDAGRTCIRLRCTDVTIVYRRTLEEMPAGREEVEEAEREGIKMMYLASPVEFTGNGKLRSVKFVKMELGAPDTSGRRRPAALANSEFVLEADTAILAIGYIPDVQTLTHNGLSLSRRGTVIVQDERGITNIKGVFAAGDVVTGPLSVVEAMASGRRAAEAIHHYFRNEPEKGDEGVSSLRPLEQRVVDLVIKSDRQKTPTRPVLERIDNFDEVDLGYTQEQACKEAMRCLSCGSGASVSESCASCLNCVRICPFGVPVPGRERVGIDVSQCQACGICASECPASAITLERAGGGDLRAELKSLVEFAREESPETLIIGFYCKFDSLLGPPLDRDDLYWIGRYCTGNLKEADILYAFELGVEGVVVHSCGAGSCRFRDGVRWLEQHVRKAKKILSETGMGEERLSFVFEDEDFTRFREGLDAAGINPLRTGKKVRS